MPSKKGIRENYEALSLHGGCYPKKGLEALCKNDRPGSTNLFKGGYKMKKIIALILGMLLCATLSYAGPFLVCDPQAGVTSYKLTGPAWVPASTPAQADGSLKLDLATSVIGVNALTVAACKTDPLWGEACSATVPFSFTRPLPPAITSNIRLTP